LNISHSRLSFFYFIHISFIVSFLIIVLHLFGFSILGLCFSIFTLNFINLSSYNKMEFTKDNFRLLVTCKEFINSFLNSIISSIQKSIDEEQKVFHNFFINIVRTFTQNEQNHFSRSQFVKLILNFLFLFIIFFRFYHPFQDL